MIRSTKNKNKIQMTSGKHQRQNIKDNLINTNNNNNNDKVNLNSCSSTTNTATTTMDADNNNNNKIKRQTKTFTSSFKSNVMKKSSVTTPSIPSKDQSTIFNKRKSLPTLTTNQQLKTNTDHSTDNNNVSVGAKKPERSHSFSLTRKITKIYNSITGSKDNLTKILESTDETSLPPPFKFTRSFSMATIPLRKSFHRSIRRPKLEQLSEESSMEKCTKDDDTVQTDCVNFKTKDPIDFESVLPKPSKLIRKNSTSSLILSSLKQTFDGIRGSSMEKTKPMNSRWSASLASLQHIDVMVSYEDLSFINYDQFNTYEKQLEKRISQNSNQLQSMVVSLSSENISSNEQPPVVVRRRKKPIQNIDDANVVTSITEWDTNYDQKSNLYRQSLNNKQLQFINKVDRKSFVLNNNCIDREIFDDNNLLINDIDNVDGLIHLNETDSDSMIFANEKKLISDENSAAICGHSKSMQNICFMVEKEKMAAVSEIILLIRLTILLRFLEM